MQMDPGRSPVEISEHSQRMPAATHGEHESGCVGPCDQLFLLGSCWVWWSMQEGPTPLGCRRAIHQRPPISPASLSPRCSHFPAWQILIVHLGDGIVHTGLKLYRTFPDMKLRRPYLNLEGGERSGFNRLQQLPLMRPSTGGILLWGITLGY